MTTFIGGPAKETTLWLRRAPIFLRVVIGPGPASAIDALDQLNDEPRYDESIVVYRKAEDRGTVHINSRDKRGRHTGGLFVSAVYRMVEMQPADATMRNTAKWREWCEANR